MTRLLSSTSSRLAIILAAAVILLTCSQPITGQSFEPGLEGQIWEALSPIGQSVNRCYPHTVDADGTIVLTTYTPVYETDPDTGAYVYDAYGSKVVDHYIDPTTGTTVDPATTGDYQRWNYYRPPCGVLSSDPYPGRTLQSSELLDPWGAAVVDPGPSAGDARESQYRIFVADQGNHRVVSFGYDSNGTFGVWKQNYGLTSRASVGNGGWGTPTPEDLSGNASADFADGQLFLPYGVAADAMSVADTSLTSGTRPGTLLVGDNSGRVTAFNISDGTVRFTYPLPESNTSPGWGSRAIVSSISIAPGTVVAADKATAAQCEPPNQDGTGGAGLGRGRITITTWNTWDFVDDSPNQNQVLIFDEKFCPVTTVGATSANGVRNTPGSFSFPDDAVLDSAGRLYVADYINNKVEIFTPATTDSSNGAPLTYNVRPAISISNTIGGGTTADLQNPYGVTLDPHGRLFVADTMNGRIAAYQPHFAGDTTTACTAPCVEYLFELRANGALAANPRAVVHDNGGRIVATVEDGDKVQVFDVPNLAVFNESASTNSVQLYDQFDVQFSIVVPRWKPGVANVTPKMPMPDGVTAVSGPTAVGAVSADRSLNALEVVTYKYTVKYTGGIAVRPTALSFSVSAEGDGGLTVAPSKTVSVPVSTCDGCERTAPVATAVVSGTPYTVYGTSMYGADTTVTITATDASTGGSKIGHVYYQLRGAEATVQSGEVKIRPTALTTFNTDPSPNVAVSVTQDGETKIDYWADDMVGNLSTKATLSLTLDRVAPWVSYDIPRTDANGHAASTSSDGTTWYRGAVDVPVLVTDTVTHTADIDVQVTGSAAVKGNNAVMHFTQEGADQKQTVTAIDLVQNKTVSWSNDVDGRGGKLINIDITGPTTTPSPRTGTTPLQVTLSADDPKPTVYAASQRSSGVKTIWYSLTSPEGPFQEYSSAISVTDSANSIWRYAEDWAGNVEAVTQVKYNRTPTATADAFTSDEDTTLTKTAAAGVLANDTDVDSDTLTAVLVYGPTHGTLTLNSDGSFTYAPIAGYYGADSFTYKANDGTVDSSVATVSITVTRVNKPPVAANDTYTTNEETLLTVAASGVLSNDADADGDVLKAAQVTAPTHGTLTLNDDGAFTYTPATNFSGTDSFTYKANDGTDDGNVATVSITVYAVNDPPVAFSNTITVPSNSIGTSLGLTAPTDIDSTNLTITVQTVPAAGQGWIRFGDTTIQAGQALTSAQLVSLVYDAPGLSTAATYAFTYAVSDGVADPATGTVTINVLSNSTPICTNAVARPNEIWPPNHKATYTISILGVADPDPTDIVALTVTGIFQDEPTNTISDGESWVDGGGIGTSIPWVRAERMGTGNGRVYQIRFTADDGNGGSCSGSVFVGVPHDQAHPAVNDHATYDSTVAGPATGYSDEADDNSEDAGGDTDTPQNDASGTAGQKDASGQDDSGDDRSPGNDEWPSFQEQNIIIGSGAILNLTAPAPPAVHVNQSGNVNGTANGPANNTWDSAGNSAGNGNGSGTATADVNATGTGRIDEGQHGDGSTEPEYPHDQAQRNSAADAGATADSTPSVPTAHDAADSKDEAAHTSDDPEHSKDSDEEQSADDHRSTSDDRSNVTDGQSNGSSSGPANGSGANQASTSKVADNGAATNGQASSSTGQSTVPSNGEANGLTNQVNDSGTGSTPTDSASGGQGSNVTAKP